MVPFAFSRTPNLGSVRRCPDGLLVREGSEGLGGDSESSYDGAALLGLECGAEERLGASGSTVRCAVRSAVCLRYVDLPPMFGPVRRRIVCVLVFR